MVYEGGGWLNGYLKKQGQTFFQNLYFEYFPKIYSEMNSTHPFYLILIPNKSYVKYSFCL